MTSTLILWLVYALFLKVAIGVATDVDSQTNTLGRAFFTAAILSLGQGALTAISAVFATLWPIVWLFVIKQSYGIGWFRSVIVWLALVAIAFTIVMLFLIPFGFLSATSGVFSLVP